MLWRIAVFASGRIVATHKRIDCVPRKRNAELILRKFVPIHVARGLQVALAWAQLLLLCCRACLVTRRLAPVGRALNHYLPPGLGRCLDAGRGIALPPAP